MREHLPQVRGKHRIKDEDRTQQTPPGTQHLLLALAKKHGPAVVEEACAVALEIGVSNYRFVHRYLERGPQLPLSLRQVDPLIRELTEYRDFIQSKTQEREP